MPGGLPKFFRVFENYEWFNRCVYSSINFILLEANVFRLTAMSGVGSSPIKGSCETSQVLLVGVPGVFPWDSPIFAQPLDTG